MGALSRKRDLRGGKSIFPLCYDAGWATALPENEEFKESTMAKPSEQSTTAGFEQWLERLREAEFSTQAAEGGRSRISKHGCAAVLEASGSEEPQFAVRPGLETSQGIAHLVDRGYQKFWQEGGRQLPALATQLQALHRFDQDLRAVMGLTALYNEALGTVSSRYVYDRLEGREKGKKHQAF